MRAKRLEAIGGLAFCILLLSRSADAYDPTTHGSITDRSFNASQGVARYLKEIGIAQGDVFDRQGVAPPGQLADFSNLGTARGWMIEGAIREDDYQSHPRLERLLGCTPPLNPHSDIDRPKSHFFDVQGGGSVLTLVGGLPAPDWALGLQGRGPADDQDHFSLPDARIYQFRSLLESSPVERDRNTALLFRTLGQVVHVLQDMAQPQHTRNDPHLGCTNALAEFVGGETSWYEVYTETRARNQRYRTRSDASRPLVLVGYGPVGLQAYRDYWANASGTGLAEFSSRNFFSAGTNLGSFSLLGGPCGGLPQPVCDPQAYRTEDFDFTIPTLAGEPLTGRVRFFLRDIADPLTGQVVRNVRVSSRSLWDQHLETNPNLETGQREPKFSLNTYNYDSIADVLLPRAVGYAAGLLDYFFRGRIEIAAPDRFVYALAPFTAGNTGAFTTLRFKVRNATPNETAGAGTIVAVVRYRTSPANLFEDPRAPLSETRLTASSEPQSITLTGTLQELTFDFRGQPLPTNSADLFLTVVYRGPLGLEENAVAVGGKDIGEPDPVAVINATDYDCFEDQPHLVAGLPLASRDLNGDGRQDLFGPHRERGVLIKVDRAFSGRTPSEQRFDFAIPEMTGGQYGRFVLLQDQFTYEVAVFSEEFQETSAGQVSKRFVRWFGLTGMINAVSEDFDGTTSRGVSLLPFQYRGLRLVHGVATTTFNAPRSCFLQTFTLPPNVTEVPGSLPPE